MPMDIGSPYIPQLHSLLHPLFADAGLPAGALQILNYSEKDVGDRVEQIISSPDVRVSLSKLLQGRMREKPADTF